MVYARALRALECITHAGPSPALGTRVSVSKDDFAEHSSFDSECSADGSAPRLGRGGPRFDPGHSDILTRASVFF